jgi:hypothetical protein
MCIDCSELTPDDNRNPFDKNSKKEFVFCVYLSGYGKNSEEAWNDCMDRNGLIGGDLPDIYSISEQDEDGNEIRSLEQAEVDHLIRCGVKI